MEMLRVVVFTGMVLTGVGLCAASADVIGEDALLEIDTRIHYAHFLGFRPGDGQVCEVNPPRFSWPYVPEHIAPESPMPRTIFALQISRSANFANLEVDVSGFAYNFYNALPSLKGRGPWHWRVGYQPPEGGKVQWSAVRTFTIAPDAVEWDRTIINRMGEYLKGHPRILFTRETWPQIRKLRDTDEISAEVFAHIIRSADGAMERSWWDEFPEDDQQRFRGGTTKFEGSKVYAQIGSGLLTVAFAHKLTGDPKYAGAKERLLKLASWAPGGFASPEGLGKVDAKNTTAITTQLGLYFDWFYDELSESERKVILDSLRWRIDHTLNNYSWGRKGGINRGGISAFTSSHPFENTYWMLPGALATYEHLEVARDAVEVGLNFLTGVTNSMGPEEAWNEGMAYGGWKFGTTLEATMFAHLTVPELHLERNPFYRRIGAFFRHLTPLGLEFCSFGNNCVNPDIYRRNHNGNFRKLAYLIGDGRLMAGWEHCHQREGGTRGFSAPWIEYVLPYYGEAPHPALETEHNLLLPVAGWVLANTQPPSDPEAYDDAVGMLFHCRPRGGYSHSFFNENTFDIFAYGSVIASHSGGSSNRNPHSRNSMSHNVVLIDGIGQRQDKLDPAHPWAGRIAAYEESEDYVYWAGDATHAYQGIPELRWAIRHVLFMRGRYFVIFDDLGLDPTADPARFSWLWHVRQDVPVEVAEGETPGIRYKVRGAEVLVSHLLGGGDLELVNLRDLGAYENPVTGENILGGTRTSVASKARGALGGHGMNNVWVTNRTPAREYQFLAVVLPWREGDEPPTLKLLGDRRFSVSWPGGPSDVIYFGPAGTASADIIIDYEGIRTGAKAREAKFLERWAAKGPAAPPIP